VKGYDTPLNVSKYNDIECYSLQKLQHTKIG